MPPEVREDIARQLEEGPPEITRTKALQATVAGDGEAMRLVLDVLQGRLGTPEVRRLVIEALGGENEP